MTRFWSQPQEVIGGVFFTIPWRGGVEGQRIFCFSLSGFHFQLHFGTVITTTCSISATVGLLSSNFQIIYINVKKKMKYRTDE